MKKSYNSINMDSHGKKKKKQTNHSGLTPVMSEIT